MTKSVLDKPKFQTDVKQKHSFIPGDLLKAKTFDKEKNQF